MVSPIGLLAAGIGANAQIFGSIFILILCTYLAISSVALKSKLYYKDDDRVSKLVTNTFLIAGTIGYAPIFIWVLGYIPFLNDLLYWLFSAVFFWTGCLLSIVSSGRVCRHPIDCQWHRVCGLLEKLQKIM